MGIKSNNLIIPGIYHQYVHDEKTGALGMERSSLHKQDNWFERQENNIWKVQNWSQISAVGTPD